MPPKKKELVRYLIKLRPPYIRRFSGITYDFGRGEKVVKMPVLTVRQIMKFKGTEYRKVTLPGKDNSRAGEVAILKTKLSKMRSQMNSLEDQLVASSKVSKSSE